MPITGLILNKGWIAVSLSEPETDFSIQPPDGQLIGTVSDTYDTCIEYVNFTKIVYNPKDAFILLRNTTKYRIIHESKIIAKLEF